MIAGIMVTTQHPHLSVLGDMLTKGAAALPVTFMGLPIMRESGCSQYEHDEQHNDYEQHGLLHLICSLPDAKR